MKLITDEYVSEMVRLHTSEDPKQRYGDGSYNWAYLLCGIARLEQCKDVLDYGCGGGSLVRALNTAGVNCSGYDPGYPGLTGKLPDFPRDLVVCLDVLEHIEPDCLDDVLAHIIGLARRRIFVAIATRPASKTLSDGRNAHLIQKEGVWWRNQFEIRRCKVRREWPAVGEWVALMNAPGAN